MNRLCSLTEHPHPTVLPPDPFDSSDCIAIFQYLLCYGKLVFLLLCLMMSVHFFKFYFFLFSLSSRVVLFLLSCIVSFFFVTKHEMLRFSSTNLFFPQICGNLLSCCCAITNVIKVTKHERLRVIFFYAISYLDIVQSKARNGGGVCQRVCTRCCVWFRLFPY